MSATAIDSSRLGVLAKIGKGGQGIVYSAPNLKSPIAKALVYKEYKSHAIADLDFAALASMPKLLTDVLTGPDARKLVAMAAWPWAIVETMGVPTGFVMPAIPDTFYLSIQTVRGPERVVAEFQHLLNDREFLSERGIRIDDHQRLRLLREVASTLAFLHRNNVCVGDLSPRNLLFALSPTEATYLVDCDTMKVGDTSALPQIETPGWEVPPGEKLATVHSDAYKLGLLALRLLIGDQDAKDAGQLPDGTPPHLRRLIAETLDRNPDRRPLPTAWITVLDREPAPPSTKSIFGAGLGGDALSLVRSEAAVLRSRPTSGKKSPSRYSANNPTPLSQAAARGAIRPSAHQSPSQNPGAGSQQVFWGLVAFLAAIILITIIAIAANR